VPTLEEKGSRPPFTVNTLLARSDIVRGERALIADAQLAAAHDRMGKTGQALIRVGVDERAFPHTAVPPHLHLQKPIDPDELVAAARIESISGRPLLPRGVGTPVLLPLCPGNTVLTGWVRVRYSTYRPPRHRKAPDSEVACCEHMF